MLNSEQQLSEEDYSLVNLDYVRGQVKAHCKLCGKEKLECAGCAILRVKYYLNDPGMQAVQVEELINKIANMG